MPMSARRRSIRYSRRARRSGSSLTTHRIPPSLTKRTWWRWTPVWRGTNRRLSGPPDSGVVQGRSSRPAASWAGGVNTKRTGSGGAEPGPEVVHHAVEGLGGEQDRLGAGDGVVLSG